MSGTLDTASPPPAEPRVYRVVHATTYAYPKDVTGSYGRTWMRPRELPHQHVRDHRIEVTPEPEDFREWQDSFGNGTAYFHVTRPHTRLEVVATSLVEISERPAAGPALHQSWERVRGWVGGVSGEEAVTVGTYALSSPRVPVLRQVQEYAAESFGADRAVGEAVLELVGRIHADFRYKSGATTVSTAVSEVLSRREGVCQDFAHVLVSGLRSLGLAARYVSGYLETRPVPGRLKLVGADASHAWVEVWVPGHGWWGVDPTNNTAADRRYVTVAWGRDYGDVPPLKGVIFTEGKRQSMDVRVDVTPLEPQPAGAG